MLKLYLIFLMCAFIYLLQALDINEPLEKSFKDVDIHILEVTYPKKCEIDDRAFFVLSKEAIASYFQNAEIYDGESAVGTRDYPHYQCEIVGKFLTHNQSYDFRLDYSGVGYIHNDTTANITICNRKDCYPCAVMDVYYDALESDDTKWLERYKAEYCVRK